MGQGELSVARPRTGLLDAMRFAVARPRRGLIARSLAPRGAAPVTPTAASKVLDERRGVWQRTLVAPSDSDA